MQKNIILSDSTLDYIKYTVVAAVYIGWEKFGLAWVSHQLTEKKTLASPELVKAYFLSSPYGILS